MTNYGNILALHQNMYLLLIVNYQEQSSLSLSDEETVAKCKELTRIQMKILQV